MPRSLYPDSKANSRFQRITIGACFECNNGSADDDAHFRTVVAMAGARNDVVDELWRGKIKRALAKVDGPRRARDVFEIMRPAPDVGPGHYRIYPADDPRVLRIVSKIIRGLAHYHGVHDVVLDGQVFADVMRHPIPEEIVAAMTHNSAEPNILQYGYLALDEPPGLISAWLLRFYQRTSFVGLVFEDDAARLKHMRS